MLGISSDALRKRAKRGTIPYETGVDGKLYVWVDAGETEDFPTGDQGERDELVEELRDRVLALEEANRENRRIIAALTSRIPQLEPPRDESQDDETAPEGEAKGDTPDEDTDEPRRSWWRRFFGFE